MSDEHLHDWLDNRPPLDRPSAAEAALDEAEGGQFEIEDHGCPRCGETTNGEPGYAGCTDPECPIP